jgi:hypothetical protein
VKEYSHNDPLKSGKNFGKKRKQVRETIKSKMAPLKSAATCNCFFFFFLLIQSNIHFAFFLLIQFGGFLTNLISYFK